MRSILSLLTVVLFGYMAITGMIPYMGLLIAAMVVVAVANIYVKVTANNNMRVNCAHGMSGHQVAELLLNKANLSEVSIVRAGSFLGEYYDPKRKVIAISDELLNSRSVTSAAVIAHEIGHAIQHKTKTYIPMRIRTLLIHLANFMQIGTLIVFILSLFTTGGIYLDWVIAIVSLSLLIQISTLPVEFNASSRALKLLDSAGILQDSERRKAKSVLKAAAYTYVASMLATILQLVRLLAIRNNRE